MPIGRLAAVGTGYSLVTFGTYGGGGVAVPLVSGVPLPQAARSPAARMAHAPKRADRNTVIPLNNEPIKQDPYWQTAAAFPYLLAETPQPRRKHGKMSAHG
jgi:hypothetical protein